MGIVVSLYDYTGIMGRPWAAAGHTVLALDLQHPADKPPRVEAHGKGFIVFHHWDADSDMRMATIFNAVYAVGSLRDVLIVFGFPPCTDLAGSGAKHWAAKLAADPECQRRAAHRAKTVAHIAFALGAGERTIPYMVENPRGALSRLWRKADHWFDPCDFGGYLPADDQHPQWPEYIPGRDAYKKATGIWCGGGFIMPPRDRVEPVIVETADGKRGAPQWKKLGGKSMKTKNIRSATPRGFAEAVFCANARTEARRAAA